MTKEQAIELLIQAAQIGQQKGAFDLSSAKLIAFAVETLTPVPEKVENIVVEDKVEDTKKKK